MQLKIESQKIRNNATSKMCLVHLFKLYKLMFIENYEYVYNITITICVK